MEKNKKSVEDRGYFRILDYVGFDYLTLSDAEYQQRRSASRFAEVPVLDELSEIDQKLQLLTDKIKIKSPDFAELGELLSKKLDLIISHSDIAKDLKSLDQYTTRQIDISATGIAFPSDKQMQNETKLQLDLVLQSGRQQLKLLANVVGCDADPDTLSGGDPTLKYVVRVNFVDVSENIREFLIQYLVKRQGALLKSQRQET